MTACRLTAMTLRKLQIVSRKNQWTKEDKGLYLAASLAGSERTVLKGLTGEECQDFDLVLGCLKG